MITQGFFGRSVPSLFLFFYHDDNFNNQPHLGLKLWVEDIVITDVFQKNILCC